MPVTFKVFGSLKEGAGIEPAPQLIAGSAAFKAEWHANCLSFLAEGRRVGLLSQLRLLFSKQVGLPMPKPSQINR